MKRQYSLNGLSAVKYSQELLIDLFNILQFFMIYDWWGGVFFNYYVLSKNRY